MALAHLVVARLKLGGYTLLDTQFVTPHLASLGAIEISRAAYRRQLDAALRLEGVFLRADKEGPLDGPRVLAALKSGQAA